MIHIVFNRPSAKMIVFGEAGAVERDHLGQLEFEAGGDAWGGPGYGHDGWCPPGHYVLGPIDDNGSNCISEGAYQINVSDIDEELLGKLVKSGHASDSGANGVDIGGLVGKIGQLAVFGRGGIMIHGGGSNDPDPLADNQPLCKTEGCTRLHNGDLERLVNFLKPHFYVGDETVVYTIVGDPVTLPC